LVETARCPQPDLNRVGLKVAVPGLPSIGGHRNSLVTNVLHLVNRPRFGKGATGVIVSNEKSSGA